MRSKGATQFGKTLYKKLTENQHQTEHLFEQIFLNNLQNMENKITDEEAQQKMSTELVNYTNDISSQFNSSQEREMAQGIVPYLMLEYVSNVNLPINNMEQIQEDRPDDQQNNHGFHKDFHEKFKANLEKLKPWIFENIKKHWKSIVGATAFGGITFAVTKFVLGLTANKALLMGGGLGLAVFLGLEVYDNFTKNK